ncbi:alkaline phosphatase [Paracrocinitomix mangrovi]|uniref:alkaline phosphatase n=1 Tax=Paracrocinitomix mangrovi TaxID=2862509 RepID=UPI001C8CF58E|nr:alkaline phosphatase [Paracrocinitomix mangrovi]UKN01323.1 alkaline phosphatase [Paracrocinitomix mangrovi]
MKKIFFLLSILPAISFGQETPIKNVILLIGDGMGLSQMSTIYYYNDNKTPNFSRFKHIGLINTSSAKQKITDSAAGATAFACGAKSYNGAISVDTNGRYIMNVVEILERKKIKSGLVATSSITHATPACFYAHAKSRSDAEKIAEYLPKSGVDFFAGGGLKFFNKRSDNIDFYTELIKKGFELDTVSLNLDKKMKVHKKYGYLLAENGLKSKLEGRDDFLPNATQHALDYLQLWEDGFFLMVEGSQIDWEGHDANAKGIIEEVKDFDKAIGVALDFAETHEGTLVIVTADHETGGFALAPARDGDGWNDNEIAPTFYKGADDPGVSYAAHTTTLIPVFAFGEGAEKFAGIYQNTDIFHKIMQLTHWNEDDLEPKDQKMKPVLDQKLEDH